MRGPGDEQLLQRFLCELRANPPETLEKLATLLRDR